MFNCILMKIFPAKLLSASINREWKVNIIIRGEGGKGWIWVAAENAELLNIRVADQN